MARSHCFICDQCGKHHAAESSWGWEQSGAFAAPANWIIRMPGSNAETPWLFCSLHCASEHYNAIHTVMKEKA